MASRIGRRQHRLEWRDQARPREIGFEYSFLIPATPDRVPCVFVENQKVVNLDPKDPIRISYEKPFPGELTGKRNPELLKMHPSHGHNQAIVNGVSRIGYMTGGQSALWTDETIVDVLSSKATAFIDRNKDSPFFLAGPYRGGKYSNFDGGARVPFIVQWAGHVKPDSQSNALISQVDLLSSLAALTDQPLPEQAGPDSMNVLPALLGRSKEGRRS